MLDGTNACVYIYIHILYTFIFNLIIDAQYYMFMDDLVLAQVKTEKYPPVHIMENYLKRNKIKLIDICKMRRCLEGPIDR